MIQQIFKWVGLAAAVISGWIGNIPDVVMVLTLIMFLDILAGLTVARSSGDLSYSTAWNGVGKKIMTLIMVGLAYIVSGMLSTPTIGVHLGAAAAGFYAIAESISVLEKAEKIGITIPDFLRDGFSRLQEKDKARNKLVKSKNK